MKVEIRSIEQAIFKRELGKVLDMHTSDEMSYGDNLIKYGLLNKKEKGSIMKKILFSVTVMRHERTDKGINTTVLVEPRHVLAKSSKQARMETIRGLPKSFKNEWLNQLETVVTPLTYGDTYTDREGEGEGDDDDDDEDDEDDEDCQPKKKIYKKTKYRTR